MVKNNPPLRRTPLTLALAMAASVAAPGHLANAQADDRRITTIEEVVVTARRVEETLQDTPVSVAAFSTRDLENMGVLQAGDVADFTPNLVMRKQSASQSNYAIAIRGVSSGETALAIDPTVGIYQDGIYIARTTGTAFDIVDLERIEVLRGPQGTLFGRNTIGGAINIITEKPRGELAAKLQAGFGARGRYNYRGTFDSPTVSPGALGDFSFKLSFMRNVMSDGTHKSLYTGGELGQFETNAQRLAMRWLPSESVVVDYAYERSRQDSNTQTHQLSGVRDLHVNLGGPYFAAAQDNASSRRLGTLPQTNSSSTESDSDIDHHGLTVEFEALPSLTIKSITGYREWHSNARGTDFGSFPADGATLIDFAGIYATPGSPVPAGTLVPMFGATRESVQRQFTQELQFIGEALDGRLNYITGLYYFTERADEFNPQQFVLPGPFTQQLPPGTSAVIGRPFFDYGTDNESYALYSQVTYTLMPDLDISLGLRYTYDKREATLTNQLDGQQAPSTVTDDDSWSNIDPSLTVNYRWADEISTYATVATGYRSGGYNARAATTEAFTTPFDEEQMISFELGLKSDWLDRRLRLNASAFHMRYDDRQIAQFEAGTGGASTKIVNAGKSENSGIEIEAMFVPTAGLRLIANYGYLHVKYKEFITGVVDPETGLAVTDPNTGDAMVADISGDANRNLYAPKHNAAGAIEYEFAPRPFGTLALRLDTTYTSDISFHPQLRIFDESGSYTLLNARATLSDIPAGRDGRLKVAAWGRNITNERYRDFGIDFGQLGFAINTYGELASWGVDVVYEFNR